MASVASPTSRVSALLGDAFDSKLLIQKITQGVEAAKAALEDAKRRIVEYDAQNNLKDMKTKAEQVLNGAVEKVQTALSSLVASTQSMKDEIPMAAISRALSQVNEALAHLMEAIHQYDENYKLSTSLASYMAAPKDQFSAAIALVASYYAEAAAAANAQLQGVSDGLRAKLAAVATASLNAANRGLDITLPVAARVDSTAHVSDIAAATSSMITTTAMDLNEKFGLLGYIGVATGKAQSLDQQVTGGKISPAVLAAYKMGLAAVGHVQERYSEAKRELAESHGDQPSKP